MNITCHDGLCPTRRNSTVTGYPANASVPLVPDKPTTNPTPAVHLAIVLHLEIYEENAVADRDSPANQLSAAVDRRRFRSRHITIEGIVDTGPVLGRHHLGAGSWDGVLDVRP